MSIRPHSFDLPLFLHVLGAMALFGAILATAVTTWAGNRRAAFVSILVAAPAYVLMRACAQWIYSKEGFTGHGDPTWLNIGFPIADAGLIVLLVTIGTVYWWQRSGKALAGRISLGLSGVYLVLLAIAWLAMSGKWG
jgi:hypothetical protein